MQPVEPIVRSRTRLVQRQRIEEPASSRCVSRDLSDGTPASYVQCKTVPEEITVTERMTKMPYDWNQL